MKKEIKLTLCAPLAILLLCANTCSVKTPPDERTEALDLLNDEWDAGCRENPTVETDVTSVTGYFRETLLIDGFNATQTFEYFQDAGCTVPVTPDQVANDEETFFLTRQSQEMSVSYPFGATTTDLGEAQHINLQVLSVAVDGVTLTEEELVEKNISLVSLLGIFIITESDRLHIGSKTQPESEALIIDKSAISSRPVSVPLDYFYTRKVEL